MKTKFKSYILIFLVILFSISMVSCSTKDDTNTENEEATTTEVVAVNETIENGFIFKLQDMEVEEKNIIEVDGEKVVGSFNNSLDKIKVVFEVEKKGKYVLSANTSTTDGKNGSFDVYVNGVLITNVNVTSGNTFSYMDSSAPLTLKEGENKIILINFTENIIIKDFKLTEKIEEVVYLSKLVTPSPSKNTLSLFNYLEESYGNSILSGQQISNTPKDEIPVEITAIKEVTGKEPAILGCDFIEYSPSRVERGSKAYNVEQALDWAKSGGIVTFAWHWNAPTDLIDQEPDKLWWSGFYTSATTFDLEKALADKESEEYKLLIRDIDEIAVQLKRLERADVPVLWRPLHEASGGWFWWGAKGPEPYKELWKIMFDRLVFYHEIDNLIWVWNGQNKDWYPGDKYVDIVSEDIYAEPFDYSSQIDKFKVAEKYSDEKEVMVAMSENGVIPDPDELVKDKALWSWFVTWCQEFVYSEESKSYSEQYTDKEMLNKVYNSEYVITKDELPDLYERGANMDFLEMTSLEMMKYMNTGWNYGNTLDSMVGDGTGRAGMDSETAWGNPYARKEVVDAISDAGFDILRVPTTWGQHMDENNIIEPEYMARVHEVVDYGIENDMFVILNTHHEAWLYPDEEHFESNKAQLTAIWEQISEEFKDYDGKLIFEVMNEPRLRGTGLEWNGGDAPSREIVSRLSEAAFNTIRSSGGNNAKRHIMIPTYAASSIDLVFSDFKIIGDDHTFISVHNYDPYEFALKSPGTDKFGSNSDMAIIDSLFDRLDKYLISKGTAVIIGETGAVDKNNIDARLVWAERMFGNAEERGVPIVAWDNGSFSYGELYGLINRETLEFAYPELIDVMVRNK